MRSTCNKHGNALPCDECSDEWIESIPRHLHHAGRPVCGARAEGALTVDDASDATCLDCLAVSGLDAVMQRRN